MDLNELESDYQARPKVPAGCVVHSAYWERTCRKGTKGCGFAHIEPEPVEAVKKVGRWQRNREALKERERMAVEDGKCYHCQKPMKELTSTIHMQGVRYFVCSANAQHTVIVIPEDV